MHKIVTDMITLDVLKPMMEKAQAKKVIQRRIKDAQGK